LGNTSLREINGFSDMQHVISSAAQQTVLASIQPQREASLARQEKEPMRSCGQEEALACLLL
jgi:hypothetical protein